MAAHHKCIKYIDEMLELVGSDGGKACQLGNCGFRRSAKDYLIKKHDIRFRMLKSYVAFCGFETTVIDISGKRKALPIDLGKPIEDENLLGSFDLILGFALIEHIEDQYEFFRNVHNLCKVGGMVILNGPFAGEYVGHGTWTYDFGFFGELFGACGYMPLDIRKTHLGYYKVYDASSMVYTAYSKVEGSKFVERESFKFPTYDPVGHEKDKVSYAECERINTVGDI